MKHPYAQYPDYLLTASSEEKLKYFNSDFTLHHKRISDILEQLISPCSGFSSTPICHVVGPTGVGKTRLSQKLMQAYYGAPTVECDVITQVPAVWLEMVVSGQSKFSWEDFYTRLLASLGDQQHISRHGYDTAGGQVRLTQSHRPIGVLRKDSESRIVDLGVNHAIIDEAQHIFKYAGKGGELNLDVIKSLSNMTKCQFILLGTYESLFAFSGSAQLARRTKYINFSAYTLQADDFLAFTSSCNGLLAHIPSELNSELASQIDDMYVGCCGCIGILKDWIARAFALMLHSGDGELTWAHMKRTRLGNRDLIRIANEIREGLAFFDEPSDAEVLSAMRTEPKHARSAQSEFNNEPNEAPRKRKARRPGERLPCRDQVPV